MEIADQIKKYRGKLKWSQEDLAGKAGISPQTVSDWEDGGSYPDIHSLLILSKLFNISLDELVKGDIDTMKKEIESNETGRSGAVKWLLAAEYLLLILTPIPLIKYLGRTGGAVWAVMLLVSLLTAVKAIKAQKGSNIRTYKEIKDYMEGKSLEEISAERIKSINKPVFRAVFGAGAALLVCTLMAYLFFGK